MSNPLSISAHLVFDGCKEFLLVGGRKIYPGNLA
jgi:hypothetical protein